MLKQRPLALVSLSLAAVMAVAMAANLPGAERSREAAALVTKSPRIDQYGKYFALSLKPAQGALPHRADAHDIVVLIDTSASQQGDFRQRSLEVLNAFLDRLGEHDRVHLIAVDTNAVSLSPSFVSPKSDEMKAALKKLGNRVPLGSTDMPLALKAAAAAYQPEMTNTRAAVYIGDGMSFVTPSEMKKMTDLLASQQIPVSSFGVGPRVDGTLLAGIANHTGGVVGFDQPTVKILESDNEAAKAEKRAINQQRTPAHLGHQLALAATEVVVWPEQLQLPEALKDIYPKQMLPLRGDRDTVLIGMGRTAEPVEVKLSATVAGQKKAFSWTIAPNPPSDDNAYLKNLVAKAQENEGGLLATLGTPGLHNFRNAAVARAENQRRLAAQVLQVNPRAAAALAQEANQADPNLLGDRLEFVAQNKVNQPPGKQPAGNGVVVNLQGDGQDGPPPGSLLQQEARTRAVQAQLLEREVQIQLNEAGRLMARDPERALANLKLIQDRVVNDQFLKPEKKSDLLKQIETAMRQVARTESVQESLRLAEQAAEAIRRDNRRLQQELRDREKQIEHWMAKYDSLMSDHKYTEAESLADLAQSVAPNNPEIANAGLNATMQRAITDGEFLRRARIRGVLMTLREVEYAHIPTPDEPPVTFPPKEWWDAMSERRAEYAAVSLFQESEAEKKIQAELKKPTEFAFQETPLSDVITFIKDLHDINIAVNRRALEDAGIVPEDTLVTRSLKGTTLKSALKLVLQELGLAYIIKDEVLLITSKDDADAYLITKVYPVGDLVVPIPSAQELQQMNGGGGFGGGFGGGANFGGGQGGQGGGFGGGGGGFGGQQGGGGGGFFRVPSSPYRAFNPDKAPIKLESPKRDARPQLASVQRGPVKAIELKPRDGESRDAAWNRYFEANKAVPVLSIRATLRQLREEKKYEEIVTVIQAALRQGQAYPWMYEAMALAMFAADSPAEEIERTLMSAADFANNTTDLMYLGQYMYRSTNYFDSETRDRFRRRALRLFRQVAHMEPTAIDAFVHGLAVAKRLEDLEAVQWATLGLVRQAWGAEDARVVQDAYRVAMDTIDKLKKSDRKKEADAFKSALDKALRRDIVVVVSWTGEADVDLMVEEPTGTVCSAGNPRTAAGGVLLPSALASPNPQQQKVQGQHSEAYVCPMGFDGNYRLVLRRAFGKPTAGKVKVEIVKHFKLKVDKEGREPLVATKWVNLGDDDAQILFDLKEGRREVALKDSQIVRTAERVEQTRDQLRRQLWEATDGETYARAQDAARRRGGRQPRRGFPRGGAPGFQPVIQPFPEGAQMTALAVISGDRRFVRISVAPQFSFIAEVNTFNFVSGQGQNQFQNQGGGGGGGFGGDPFGGGGGGQGGGFQGGGGGGFGGGGGGGGGLGGGGGGGPGF